MTDTKEIRLILLGFGNVGQSLVRLLEQRRAALFQQYGVSFVLTGIVTANHGAVYAEGGIAADRVLERAATWKAADPELPLGPALDAVEVIRSVPAEVVVELTTLNMDDGQPAVLHVEEALKSGKHVVTANKGPVAFAHGRLNRLAARCERRLLFEATVMDGTPLFNMVKTGLRGARIESFRGILNSTTNFILGELEGGSTLEEAVSTAQRRGFAEADPRMDIKGQDAAAKTAVLANALLGADMTPREVCCTGIENLSAADVKRAAGRGERIKLVCAGWRRHCGAQETVAARVAPEAVPLSSFFAQVSGTSSVLTLSTDLMGDISIVETEPELMQTAYGVFNDLVELVNGKVS